MKKLLQTEFRVAFHKESQPLWVRITKYLLLILFVFFFLGHPILLVDYHWAPGGCHPAAWVLSIQAQRVDSQLWSGRVSMGS